MSISMANQQKRRRTLQIETLENRRLLASDFELFDTLRSPGIANDVVATRDAIYFAKEDSRFGRELWRADRDGRNAALLTDIVAGPQGSDIESLTVVGQRLFFIADDGVHGRELWMSDGTAQNTRLVVDLAPGRASGFLNNLYAPDPDARELPFSTDFRGLLSIGDKVLFEGTTGGLSTALWISDGTADGTLSISPPVAENTVRSNAVQAFVRGDRILYVQMNQSVSSDRTSVLYVGSPNDGFVPFEDIYIDPFDSRPLNVFASLRKGTLFSIDDAMYSLTETGNIDRISDSALFSAFDFSQSSDGHAVFFSQLSGPLRDVFRTDGTSEGTERFNEQGFSSKPLLLSRDVFVTTSAVHPGDRSLVTLSEQAVAETIAYAPRTFDIDQLAISPTAFLTFEFDRFTNSRTHLLRLIDIQQKISSVIFETAADEAIAQVLKNDKSLFLTIASKDTFRIVELDLERETADTKTIATYDVVDEFESVDLKLIGGSLMIEYVSSARTELLLYQAGELQLISTVEVGHPGWRDYYLPYSNLTTGIFTDNRLIRAKEKTFHNKIVSSELTQSGKISPYSQNYVDLGKMPYQRGTDFLPGLGHIGDSVLYFINSGTLDPGETTRNVLVASDALGNSRELFSVAANRVDGGFASTVSPLGSFRDRFYFAAYEDDSWSLYRTNANLDGIDLISEAFAGPEVQRVRKLAASDPKLDGTHRADNRLLITTEKHQVGFEFSEILDFDFESQELRVVLDFQNAETRLLTTPRWTSGTEQSLLLHRNDLKNFTVEVGRTRKFRDFFTESQLAGLGKPFGVNETPIRIQGAWIAFVPDITGKRSLWRLSDSSDTAIKLEEFPNAAFPFSRMVVAVTDSHVLFQVLGTQELWTVDGQSAGIKQVTNGSTGVAINMPIRAIHSQTSGKPVLLGGLSELYTISESGDVLNLLGTVPSHLRVRAVEQVGEQVFVFTEGMRVYRLVRNVVTVPTEGTAARFTLGSVESNWILTNENGDRSEFPKPSTGAIVFDDFNRSIEFSIDFGSNQISAIPSGDVTLTLSDHSTLHLTGSVASAVVYTVRGDSLEIRIGDQKLLLRLRGPLHINDTVHANKRTVNYGDDNDDVSIQLDSEGRTKLTDNNRQWSVSFPVPALLSQVPSDALQFHLQIDTGSGIDRITVSPNYQGTGLVDITSRLDAANRLALSLPQGWSLPKRETINGRFFQQLSLEGWHLRAEITNHPSHNLANPADVDGNGYVQPLDALQILIFMSERNRGTVIPNALLYGDVTGDSMISALDALRVIIEISKLNIETKGDAVLVPMSDKLKAATDEVFDSDAEYDDENLYKFLF